MPTASLQAMPALACGTAMVWGLQVFYSLGSSQGRQIVTWSPQATVLLLVLIGIGGCLVTCLAVPRVQRLRNWRGPTKMPLKRMNLLGLVRAAALLSSSCPHLLTLLARLLAHPPTHPLTHPPTRSLARSLARSQPTAATSTPCIACLAMSCMGLPC